MSTLIFEHVATTASGTARIFAVALADGSVAYRLTDEAGETRGFDSLNDWLVASANLYEVERIWLGRIDEDTLASTDGDLFQPRLDGDTVRLGGNNIGGNYRFRFATEEDAAAFFTFFDRIDEFVENTDLSTTAPICFTPGVRLAAPAGEVLIDALSVGDRLLNMAGEAVTLRWIGRRRVGPDELSRNPKWRPVRIRAGALGDGLPRRDLVVSRQHRMLLRSRIAMRMFGTPEVLVPAIRLAGLPGIAVDPATRAVEYIHLLFDRHEILCAEGAPSESLYTGAETLKSLSPEARAEVLGLFPALADPGHVAAPARVIPLARQQKRLVARHRKSGKPLLAA